MLALHSPEATSIVNAANTFGAQRAIGAISTVGSVFVNGIKVTTLLVSKHNIVAGRMGHRSSTHAVRNWTQTIKKQKRACTNEVKDSATTTVKSGRNGMKCI